MSAYILEWFNLIFRWLHFTAGVMWIGTSLYFVWLDNSLSAPSPEDARQGASGELWSVHGGGFYHNVKYPTGPKGQPLTPNLHWFKWEAYTTWISGMIMLAIVYWVGASAYLIDKSVLDLTPAAAIGISLGTIILGYAVYDLLCHLLAERPLVLGVAVYAFMVFAAWGLFHLFGARAAYIHMGAIMGTIMAANVAHWIIPGQRKMVGAIRAGQVPDSAPGRLGKIRSVHNTYFTLPVLFTMISIHYPMTYGSSYGWLVLAVLGLTGVLVRYFFILADKKRFVWGLPIAALLLLAIVAFALVPRESSATKHVSFAQIQPIIARRCAVCHSPHPAMAGYGGPPLGLTLDSPANIAANAQRIYQQAVATHAMPLGNATQMTDAERALLGAWIKEGAQIR